MSLVDLVSAKELVTQDKNKETVRFFPDQPVLYEQPGCHTGKFPTYIKHVLEDGIMPAHSVTGRTIPTKSAGQHFTPLPMEMVETPLEDGEIGGESLPPCVCTT